MEKDTLKLIVEIPEVPLRSLDSKTSVVEKISQLNEELAAREIVFRQNLSWKR
jgi:hypothetical protein